MQRSCFLTLSRRNRREEGKFIFLIALMLLLSIATFAQKNLSFLGNISYGSTINDIWGYVDTANNEYAIVGLIDSVSIVDVTDPANPTKLFSIGGPSSIWRDMKTWNDHAYVVHDAIFSGTPMGLLIIDLSNLPASIDTLTWDTLGFEEAHNIFIDENGIAYLFGSNIFSGGALMLDLADPKNPVYVGNYDVNYVHDGYVRGDTMWTSEVYDGWFAVVDVSDKANPVVLATQSTPDSFAHNCWLSDDGKTLFTTDEAAGAFVAAYDVSDLGNIKLLDSYRVSSALDNVIPHNTHVYNDFLVTSYYRSGVIIIDANKPDNLVETGNYDTSPFAGMGYEGCWGVYPFLPSGNILATDGQEGLFVLSPTYIRACYLEGVVTDSVSGDSLNNVTVELISTSASTSTDLLGGYKTGIVDSGTYQIRFSRFGYVSKIIDSVDLKNSIVTILNVKLNLAPLFTFSGQVIDATTNNPVPNAIIGIENIDSINIIIADISGDFSIFPFYAGQYDIYASKWNYELTWLPNQTIDTSIGSYIIELDSGIYDDYTLDLGWTESGNATSGQWEKAKPIMIVFFPDTTSPGEDINNDYGKECYITGNGGFSPGSNDVDGGNTALTSPAFDLSSYKDPYISYYRWFYNGGGFSPLDDTLNIKLSNGTDTVLLERVDSSNTTMSMWVFRNFKVSDYITITNNMQIIFDVADEGNGHLVEAAIDVFSVVDSSVVDTTGIFEITYARQIKFSIYPNPFNDQVNIDYDIPGELEENAMIKIYDLLGRVVREIPLERRNGTMIWDEEINRGMYFMQLINGSDASKMAKVMKF